MSRGPLLGGLGTLQTPAPTRDSDLLGRLKSDLESVRAVIAQVCQPAVDDGGLFFRLASVATERIAEDAEQSFECPLDSVSMRR